jgi:hypothetical protein
MNRYQRFSLNFWSIATAQPGELRQPSNKRHSGREITTLLPLKLQKSPSVKGYSGLECLISLQGEVVLLANCVVCQFNASNLLRRQYYAVDRS